MKVRRPTLFIALWLVALPVFARELSFEERVKAQRVIEKVYYAHQIGTTRPFDEAVPRSILEKKVQTYLRQSVALEKFWQTPVTAPALQSEMHRIAKETHFAGRLREIYAALGHDFFLVQECVARPVLVDRLARNFLAGDARFQAAPRAAIDALRRDLENGQLDPSVAHPARTVLAMSRSGESGANSTQESADGPLGKPLQGLTYLALEPAEFASARSRAPQRVGEIGTLVEDQEAFSFQVLLSEANDSFLVATYSFPKRTFDEWSKEVAKELPTQEARSAAVDMAEPRTPGVGGTCSVEVEDHWDNGS